MPTVQITLFGGFRVVVEGRPVSDDDWRRRASELVKLLALQPEHRLDRERVIEALWPKLAAEAGAANLHKAAHYARRALGQSSSLVLRGGQVLLWPDASLNTDVERFEASADPAAYGGELLPEDRYADWTLEPRERLRLRYLELLGSAGRWAEVVQLEPADERAHRALMRTHADTGDRHAALRQFRRLRDALAAVGLRPDEATMALHHEIARGPAAVAPVAEAPPMVGRKGELAEAQALVREAAAGRVGALIVVGDAGVGKTRLCEELLARAARDGWTTLRGAAREEEGSTPYAPIVEALERLLGERPDLAAGLDAPAWEELARLASPSPGLSPVDPRPGRQRIFFAVARVLAAAAAERGTILLVEDLHAADEATLQLLHYLARSARFQPLLLVMSGRTQGPSGPLAQLRRSLLEQRVAREIALGPLDRAASFRLIERAAPHPPAATTRQSVWTLAGGNPFFLEELAAAVSPEGTVEVPARLYEILDARLARLERGLASVLARAAVAGVQFTADELMALAGLEEDSLHTVLDAALAAGVLEEAQDGYRFRHALVREALVRALPAHRRAAAHRQAAERLATIGAAPARIGRHFLLAGLPERASPWLAAAAEQAMSLGAFADALGLAEAALANSGPAAADLLALRADLLFLTGDGGAPIAYAEAVAVAPRGRRPGLRIKQARAHLVAGDVRGAERSLEGVSARTTADRRRLLLMHGMIAWFAGDIEEARRRAEEAEPLVRAAGLGVEMLEVTQLEAIVAHSGGDWRGRAGLLPTESQRFPELGAMLFDAHLCVAEYLLYSGEPYDALAAFAKELRAASERSGARRGEAFAATLLGEAELLGGQLERAEQDLREAVELNWRIGATGGEALARMRLGEAVLAMGRREEAGHLLEEALDLARWSSLAPHLLYMIYGVMVRAAPDPQEAVELVDRIEAIADARPVCVFCPIGYHVAAAIALATTGDLERARSHLVPAEMVASVWRGSAWEAAVTEASATIALANGDPDAAALAFEAAAAGFARAGQPLAEARCRASVATVA